MNVFKITWVFQDFYLGQYIHYGILQKITSNTSSEIMKQFSTTIKINWTKTPFYASLF